MQQLQRYVPLINMGGDYCGFGRSEEYPEDDEGDGETRVSADGEWYKAEEVDALLIARNQEDAQMTEPLTDEALAKLAEGRSTESVLGIGCEFALAPMARELLAHRRATHADDLRAAVTLPRAWLDVMGERTRQMAVEGWMPEHDDEYDDGELANAAACYALTDPVMDPYRSAADEAPVDWPFTGKWWKPTDRRRDLVKAGALILAEIERLDRAALSQSGGCGMSGPTREDVTDSRDAFIVEKMLIENVFALQAKNAALRERLEAAEEDADLQKTAASVWQQASLKNQAALTEALTAVKDAEWNAAIEAAADCCEGEGQPDYICGGDEQARRVRALRRKPKEGKSHE